MNVLKHQLAWIQQQLSQLTSSQKMLAASLAALMCVTVVYWGKYAATPEMTVVVDATFTPDRAGAIIAMLKAQGINATIGGDSRIMVQSDQQLAAVAQMAWNKMLPADSSAAIDKIVSQMTLWDSAAKTDKLWNQQKEIKLGQVIARWPDVDDAQVHIDIPDHRSLALPTEPRASVNITMKDGVKANKAIAVSAAEFLVGSTAGLTRGNVRVAINGQIVRVGDDDPGGIGSSGEILEQKQGWDRWYTAKVEKALQGFPSPIVTVSVELDLTKQNSTQKTLDPKNVVQYNTQTRDNTEQSTSTAASGEPGVVPNTGSSIAPGAATAGPGDSRKDNWEMNLTAYGEKVTETATPAGNGTPTVAAVQIPHSYFVEVWKRQNPTAKSEPEEPLLQPLMTSEFEKIRSIVMSSTNIRDPKAVSVTAYFDMPPEPIAAAAGKGGQVLGIVNGYGKEIGLSALALLSLMMVSGIVKRGAAPVAAVTADALAAQKREFENMVNKAAGVPTSLDDGVSSALEGSTALEALELDDETNQTQQMVQQVTNLVKENPDGAVSLVKRWMNRP
jgi:flagellar biosynthesis/type III secretory pathway M-ring protein FliF/YscJ